MSPIKDEFLANYQNKIFDNLTENKKKSAFKLSIEGNVLLIFVSSSQIFPVGLLAIAINKVQSFSYN